jgi:thiol-disulfide isomerase/thioredoxin
MRCRPSLSGFLALTLIPAAFGGPGALSAAEPDAHKEASVLVGPTQREAIETASPEWIEAEVSAHPEAGGGAALASIEPGAEVVIFLGTWCGDSRREVPRLWKAIDEGGGVAPFALRYVAVDREKKEPAAEIAASGVRYLPTLIVRRNGQEVGRIVESSPHGVEKDLADLLSGRAHGLLTLRTDLGTAGTSKPPA